MYLEGDGQSVTSMYEHVLWSTTQGILICWGKINRYHVLSCVRLQIKSINQKAKMRNSELEPPRCDELDNLRGRKRKHGSGLTA